MWWQAFRQVLWSDMDRYAFPAMLPLLGAALGASVGSIRRWYWARWQVGFFIGWWLGSQIGVLLARFGARVLPGVPDYDQLLIMLIAAIVIGLLASLMTEYLLTIPFWFRWEQFRDAPFRWLRSRPVLVLGLFVICSLPALWLGFRWEQIAEVEQHGRLAPLVNELNREWEPYQVHFAYNPGGYSVAISSAQALEEPVIQEFDRLPGPIRTFCISPGDDFVGDESLRRMAPRLQTVRIISLHNTQVTKDCLENLAAFHCLQELEFVNCPQLAKDDFLRFHKNRPDVRLFVQNPNVHLHLRPKNR